MLSIKHLFSSAKLDGPDVTLVKPSNWNDVHQITTTQTVPIVLGRQTVGAGAIEELPLSAIFPTGVVVPFAGLTAPGGWLLCAGQSVPQSTYPLLYAVILKTYGGTSTNFTIPDLRGAVVAGKSNMNGADRGNLPNGATVGYYQGAATVGGLPVSVSVSVSGGISGSTSGSQSVNITSDGESHGSGGVAFGGSGYFADSHTHVVQGNTGGEGLGVSGSFSGSGSGSGGTSAFGIVQPTIVLNYIIKT